MASPVTCFRSKSPRLIESVTVSRKRACTSGGREISCATRNRRHEAHHLGVSYAQGARDGTTLTLSSTDADSTHRSKRCRVRPRACPNCCRSFYSGLISSPVLATIPRTRPRRVYRHIHRPAAAGSPRVRVAFATSLSGIIISPRSSHRVARSFALFLFSACN